MMRRLHTYFFESKLVQTLVAQLCPVYVLFLLCKQTTKFFLQKFVNFVIVSTILKVSLIFIVIFIAVFWNNNINNIEDFLQ